MNDQAAARETRLVGWLTFFYLVSLLFIARFETFNFFVNRLVSPLMVLFVIYKYINRPVKLPSEIYLFFLFVLWATSGVVVAANLELFWKYYRLIFQVGILFLVVAFLVSRYGILNYVLLGFLATGMLFFLSSVFTGDIGTSLSEVDETYRLATIAKNANGYAYALLLAEMAVFYFLGRVRRPTMKLLLFAVIVPLLLGIVFSASRKAYLTFIVFAILYTAYYAREKYRSLIVVTVALILTSAVLYYVTDYVITNSFLGKRFQELQDVEKLTYGNNRYWLYIDGFKMLAHSPIMGVGLGQFEVLSSTQGYAHSDFMEVAATTGLVGLLIYGAVYFILLRRVTIARRYSPREEQVYEMHFIQATIISLVMMAFGRPNFLDIFTMPLIAAFVGYSFYLLSRYRLMRSESSPAWQAALPRAGAPLPGEPTAVK